MNTRLVIFTIFAVISCCSYSTSAQTCPGEQVACNTASGSVCCGEGEQCRVLPSDSNIGICCNRQLCCDSNGQCTCPEEGTYCCSDNFGTICNSTDVCCGAPGEAAQCCSFIEAACKDNVCIPAVNPEVCVEASAPPCQLENGTVACCEEGEQCVFSLPGFGNQGDCCPTGTGCPLTNGSIACVTSEDEQCCFGHVCPADTSCCGDSDCCSENEVCLGSGVDATCQPVIDECEGFNCGPNDRCCNDKVLGKVCYNDNTHKCAEGIKLCGKNDEVCDDPRLGLVCYDPIVAHCIRDVVTDTYRLCGIRDAVCNGICYNFDDGYRCVNGQLVHINE